MTLTLTIANVDRLDNGSPVALVLDRRGATIGRSPSCDWSLPDPRHHISSRHCEIVFRDGAYVLTDVSTNGTLLNGAAERMAMPRRIESGDRFQIGPYQVVAAIGAGSPVGAASGWDGWNGGGRAPAVSDSGWGRPSPAAASWDLPGPAERGWDRPAAPPPPPPAHDWGQPPAAPVAAWPETVPAAGAATTGWDGAAPAAGAAPDWLPAPASDVPAASPWDAPAGPTHASAPSPFPPAASLGSSDWLSPPPPVERAGWDSPPVPAAAADVAPRDDVWSKVTEGNTIDWSRGGFGHADEISDQANAAADPWAPLPAAAPPPLASSWPASPDTAAAAAPASDDQATFPPGPMPVAADPTAIVDAFATAAGLRPGQLKAQGIQVLEQAGSLLRQLVAGLVVMVEARARAKSQMGAESTSLSFDGNNPIKFARAPDQALAQLLNPKERGFMAADAAIEDAFRDLQSHQMATLKAMQGALRSTLDRFSPAAIKGRAESKGLMARIMPGAREAALWQAYEREFGGVAQGSDEAFMDVFAKEFRKAYEEQTNARGGPRR